MINDQKILAIIPARGGSKRLPRKNVLDFYGKPLVAWTIDAAMGCDCIDRVVLSTDDEEIASIGRGYGADAPYMRPAHLATDEATTIDVVLDLVATLAMQGERYDIIILLQPTSPLRTQIHIEDAINQMVAHKARAIISVCQVEHHPLWCNTLPDDLSMNDFIRDEIKNRRSQDLPIYYRLNGAIYICEIALLTEQNALLPSVDSIAYIMSQEDSVDIDTVDDFERAQAAMDRRGER